MFNAYYEKNFTNGNQLLAFDKRTTRFFDSQFKSKSLAASQIAATAGCLTFRSADMA